MSLVGEIHTSVGTLRGLVDFVGLMSKSITIIGMYLTRLGMVHLGCMASEHVDRPFVRRGHL